MTFVILTDCALNIAYCLLMHDKCEHWQYSATGLCTVVHTAEPVAY